MVDGALGTIRRASTVALACVLAGCGLSWDASEDTSARPRRTAVAPASGRYTVQPGDTLYSIAFRYRLDHKRLAAWNALGDAGLIYPGQTLRLTAPSGQRSGVEASRRTAAKETLAKRDFRWPTTGRVVSAFDPDARVASTGILIGGQRGQPVNAADAGEVIFSGSALKGYGKLIIIRHDEHYLSAYGHNSALLVAEGERVERGQRIATMGSTQTQQPRLHFEIRVQGKPVDPLPLLPRR